MWHSNSYTVVKMNENVCIHYSQKLERCKPKKGNAHLAEIELRLIHVATLNLICGVMIIPSTNLTYPAVLRAISTLSLSLPWCCIVQLL